MHRAWITIESLGDIGEIHRRGSPLQLVGAGETFDEAAQAEAIEVVGCNAGVGNGLGDHIHAWTWGSSFGTNVL